MLKGDEGMEKQVVDTTVFWESSAKHHADEHEDERRHIEGELNAALAGTQTVSLVHVLADSAVLWEGVTLRGVHHIRVGDALELAFLDETGDVLVESGELPTCDRLYLRTWPDGLLEISTDEEDDA